MAMTMTMRGFPGQNTTQVQRITDAIKKGPFRPRAQYNPPTPITVYAIQPSKRPIFDKSPAQIDFAYIIDVEDSLRTQIVAHVDGSYLVTRKKLSVASSSSNELVIITEQRGVEFNSLENRVILFNVTKPSGYSGRTTKYNHAILPRSVEINPLQDQFHEIAYYREQYPGKVLFYFDLASLCAMNDYSPMDLATIINTEDSLLQVPDIDMTVLETRKTLAVATSRPDNGLVALTDTRAEFDALENQVITIDVRKLMEQYSGTLKTYNYEILPRNITISNVMNDVTNESGVSDFLSLDNPQGLFFFFDLGKLLSSYSYSPMDGATIVYKEDTISNMTNTNIDILATRKDVAVLNDGQITIMNEATQLSSLDNQFIFLDVSKMMGDSNLYSKISTFDHSARPSNITKSLLFDDGNSGPNYSGVANYLSLDPPPTIFLYFDFDMLLSVHGPSPLDSAHFMVMDDNLYNYPEEEPDNTYRTLRPLNVTTSKPDNGVIVSDTSEDVEFYSLENRVITIDIDLLIDPGVYGKIAAYNSAILPRSVKLHALYNDCDFIHHGTDLSYLIEYDDPEAIVYFFDIGTLFAMEDYSPIDTATIIYMEDTLSSIPEISTNIIVTEKEYAMPSPDNVQTIQLDVIETDNSDISYGEITVYDMETNLSCLFTTTFQDDSEYNQSGVSDFLALDRPMDQFYYVDLEELLGLNCQ